MYIKRVSAFFFFIIMDPYQTETERPAAKNKLRWRCHNKYYYTYQTFNRLRRGVRVVKKNIIIYLFVILLLYT